MENTKINGNGPVDVAFNAIKLTNTEFKLKLYQVNAITAGTDAQGEVTVRLEEIIYRPKQKEVTPILLLRLQKLI